MIEKKMELLEEENDRLKKEIENLREACKVQEQNNFKIMECLCSVRRESNDK